MHQLHMQLGATTTLDWRRPRRNASGASAWPAWSQVPIQTTSPLTVRSLPGRNLQGMSGLAWSAHFWRWGMAGMVAGLLKESLF